MILRFKCVSERDVDFHTVFFIAKRFRGCNQGNPIMVRGINMRHAQDNLRVIIEALSQIPDSKVLIRTSTTFEIEMR